MTFLKNIALSVLLFFILTSPAYAHNPGAVALAGIIILLLATFFSALVKYFIVRNITKSIKNNEIIKYCIISFVEFVLIVISLSIIVELQAFDHIFVIFFVATLLYLLPASLLNNLLISEGCSNSKLKKWSNLLLLSLVFPLVSTLCSIFGLSSLTLWFY